ncbi:MAG: hypothetical protein K0Q79_1796 [Flavipsychrobacter sp.]|jgi:hypothetical protein|nr:hypothetical protein [Flavipsychrobacter sp.]
MSYPTTMFPPFFVDEFTGNMYYNSYFGFNVYNPNTNENREISIPLSIGCLLQFNKNDGMFYGFKSQEFFCKFNPSTNLLTEINSLAIPPISNGYDFSTFDSCKNQYIVHDNGYLIDDTTVNIYWVDLKTAKIVKHTSAKGLYYNLFNVNID